MSVERVDEDKDADENVDADQISMRRLVSGQSIGLFTQREEIDIDFRVSGLPHAVVQQVENFRVRELVKKMESHPHREALQADLQQSNAYNPLSEESKVMIREMANVELFDLCETIPKVQCSECLLYWNQGIVYCTCGHLLVESESSQIFHQWRLDALSIPHYVIKKEKNPTVLGTAKLRHRKSISWPATRGRDVSKRIMMEFTIVSNEIQFIVIRNSKLVGAEEKCIEMGKLAQEDHSYRLSYEEYERYQKHWYLTLNKSGKNAPMRLRSDFRTAVTLMKPSPPRIRRITSRAHTISTVPKVAHVFFFFFFQYLMVAVG